jgi:hypothetical protein
VTSLPRCLRLLPLLAVLLAACGCQTTPRIDWAARLGQYTYDQAVLDFGPPERYAKLSDNTVVAEWLTRRGHHTTYLSGGYYGWYPWYYGPPPPTYIDTYSADYFLRLTFGPDGKLAAWKKLAR